MSYPLVKDLTVTAEAELVDIAPMATEDKPDRHFRPEKIAVKYWPTPEGWSVWSIYISGRALLKSGSLGKRDSASYYTSSKYAYNPIGGAPDWAREFAAAHCPRGGQ